MKDIVIVIDQSGNEAIYVDEKLHPATGDMYFYATELVPIASGRPITLRQVEVEVNDFPRSHWPEQLADLKPC